MNKIGITMILLVCAMSQTGCFCAMNAENQNSSSDETTEYAVGAMIGLVGGALTSSVQPVVGGVMMAAGVVLDQKNPGRVDTLNMLPLTESLAKKYGVTVNDIEAYNDELSSVIRTHQNIQSTLTLVKEKQGTETSLNDAAISLGLKDGHELVEVLKADKLSEKSLENFAQAQSISKTSAKIYLQSLGIKL